MPHQESTLPQDYGTRIRRDSDRRGRSCARCVDSPQLTDTPDRLVGVGKSSIGLRPMCAALLLMVFGLMGCERASGLDPSGDEEPSSPATVIVRPDSAEMGVGDSVNLSATVEDTVGTVLHVSVEWSSSDTSVASVDSVGTVRARNWGGTRIRARAGTASGSARVAVSSDSAGADSAPPMPTSVAVSEDSRTDTSVHYAAEWDGSDRAESYAWSAGSDEGRWSESGSGGSGLEVGFTAPRSASADSSSFCVRAENEIGESEPGCTDFTVPAEVTGSSGSVASVQVTPDSAAVEVGSSVQLSATVTDTSGEEIARSVSWSSSNAAIAAVDGSGTVTGQSAGTAMVKAQTAGESDSASIHVAESSVDSTSASAIDTIFHDGFESGSLAEWDDGVDPDRHQIVSDPSFADDGSRYLEITYPPGETGGWLTRFFMPGYDSIYVSYSVRFSSGWEGNTKMLALYGSRTDDRWSAMGQAGNCPDGDDFFASMLVTEDGSTGDPGPVRFYTYYPDMAREPDGSTCWGQYGDGTESYYSPTRIEPDTWHRVEFWVRLNEIGSSDAAQRFWLDGQLRGEWEGFVLRTSDVLRLNSVQITANGQAPERRYMYLDDLLVATGVPNSGRP